jgi:hypothetical protein
MPAPCIEVDRFQTQKMVDDPGLHSVADHAPVQLVVREDRDTELVMRVASDDGFEACGNTQRVENGDITRKVDSYLPGISPLCFYIKRGASESLQEANLIRAPQPPLQKATFNINSEVERV